MDTITNPKLIHRARLACPFCGFREELAIPADFCLIFHRCANCNMPIKPAPGDCCVFCSYGDARCRSGQAVFDVKHPIHSTKA